MSPATPFFWLRIVNVAAVAVKKWDGCASLGSWVAFDQKVISPRVKIWVWVFSFLVSVYSTDLSKK